MEYIGVLGDGADAYIGTIVTLADGKKKGEWADYLIRGEIVSKSIIDTSCMVQFTQVMDNNHGLVAGMERSCSMGRLRVCSQVDICYQADSFMDMIGG